MRTSAQLIPDLARWQVRFDIHPGIPLKDLKGTVAPTIEAQLTLDIRSQPQAGGGAARAAVWLWGSRAGLPADEIEGLRHVDIE
ncbi:hypothetical protein FBY35_0094 [Streptomyces sp. SLBN-118]|nr:hypothetical protein FBY35_0094 [Streptomyces sp. SLBN-118]